MNSVANTSANSLAAFREEYARLRRHSGMTNDAFNAAAKDFLVKGDLLKSYPGGAKATAMLWICAGFVVLKSQVGLAAAQEIQARSY